MLYSVLTLIMFLVMIFYFKVASHYDIVDKPNERSSHRESTIRGGGVVFLIAAIAACILCPDYWIVIIGIFAIGLISFLDDRITLSNKIRLFVHLISVTLLFLALELFMLIPLYTIVALYILVIGVINAYNFMDGINGITGVYSVVILLGLQYLNYESFHFVEPDMIWLPIISCAVFLFFNFRKNAICFAGDVGSITIAFWIAFLLLKLIVISGNVSYILFLLIYGLDSVTTILFRLFRKENIFKAHRSHFYQYLANERKISHLIVSSGYAIAQLIVIIICINASVTNSAMMPIVIIFSTLIFVAMRFYLEGRARLLGRLSPEINVNK